jgi:hypothetical protein
MRLERVDAQPGGQAGGAESHRVARGQAVGQRDDPRRRHARVLRPAAVVGDAEVVAGHEYLAADGDRVVVGGHYLAREVDPGHERRDPRHLALGDRGQRVLVVEA